MELPTTDNTNHQKALALIICLFLFWMYKETVYDAYFKQDFKQLSSNAAVPNPATKKVVVDDYVEEESSSSQTNAAQSNIVENSVVETVASKPEAAQATPAAVEEGKKKYPSDKQIEDAGILKIKTAKISTSVSLLGGRITSLQLNDYAESISPDSPPLNLIDHIEHAPYPLAVYSGSLNDSWVQYRVKSGFSVDPQRLPLELQSTEDNRLVLEGQLADGRQITKTLTFYGDGYFIDVDVSLTQPAEDFSRVSLEWTRLLAKNSPKLLDPYEVSGYVWFIGEAGAHKALRESFNSLSSDSIDLSNIKWLSMADKYFLVSLISDEGLIPARILRTGQLYRARVEGGDRGARFRVFAGPKSYSLLKSLGEDLQMQRNIDFGYSGIIAAPLLSLLHLLNQFFANYGLSIIMLTIIVKLCLYPLTASSFKQMKAMQDLSPELKRIRDTIKDKQKQQQEMMALYKKKGVNPLGGCFPMLLQMPVFIGLYSSLLLAIELRHAPFALWIHDLSSQERLMVAGVGIPVMVILFVISMLVQQWMTPTTVDPAQKKMMMAMPLVFGFMFASMPAGLTLYWLTNNLISIGQQVGLKNNCTKSALRLTVVISVGVFLFAYLLTLIG